MRTLCQVKNLVNFLSKGKAHSVHGRRLTSDVWLFWKLRYGRGSFVLIFDGLPEPLLISRDLRFVLSGGLHNLKPKSYAIFAT